MIGELFINGKDAFETWGIFLDSSGLSALFTPPPTKEVFTNSSAITHGLKVVTDKVRLDSRDITLTLNMTASSKSDFLQKYASFCEELKAGNLVFQTKYQEGIYYRMFYRNCQQFSEYALGAAKFLLRLTEFDPSNRAAETE